jgi:hypothetical protein
VTTSKRILGCWCAGAIVATVIRVLSIGVEHMWYGLFVFLLNLPMFIIEVVLTSNAKPTTPVDLVTSWVIGAEIFIGSLFYGALALLVLRLLESWKARAGIRRSGRNEGTN